MVKTRYTKEKEKKRKRLIKKNPQIIPTYNLKSHENEYPDSKWSGQL